MSSYLDLAIKIAKEVHKHEVDKIGQPYILHPIFVMNSPTLKTDTEKSVAVLHDVLESDPSAELYLKSVRMPQEVMDALYLLTRDKKDTYGEYIEKIAKSKNLIAIKVKLADLEHNSSEDRMKNLSKEKAASLLPRYKKATVVLTETLKELTIQ